MFSVVYKIITLILLGLVGFTAGRFGYVPKTTGKILSNIVIRITMPFLIITTLTSYKFKKAEILDGLWIYLFGVIFLLLAFFVSYIVSGKLKLKEETGNIYKMQSIFGNVVFLAFPLLETLFGARGRIFATFFYLANDTVLWTLGIYLVNKHNTTKWKDNLKHLINANTIAFTLGIIAVAFDFQYYLSNIQIVSKMYNLFYNSFSSIGNATTPISMLFIGLILAEVKITSMGDFKKRTPIFILSLFKLLIIPLFAFLVLLSLGNHIPDIVKYIVVLQLAMPCGTITTALASQYDSDYCFATECAFFSTIISIASLPLIIWMLNIR
jgi:malate permease and related proteins